MAWPNIFILYLVMFYLLYKHQSNTKPFQFNSSFAVKGAIYCVAIATVIFSPLKISCFRAKAHLVFLICNKIVYVSSRKNTLTC